MQKPLTLSISTYYGGIIKNLMCSTARKIQRNFNRISGRWYCGFCQKHHHKRTIAFDYSDGLADNVCSHGVRAAGHYPGEAVPGRKITQRQINLTAYGVDEMFNAMPMDAMFKAIMQQRDQ